MARDDSYVQNRIAELDGSALSSVKKEVSELHTILYPDEDIYAVACGQIGSDMHLMTVTDRRILLTYKSMMGKTQLLELPLSQVKSVSQKTGLLLAELLIDTGGQTKRFKNVPKVLAENVTTAVSKLLHSSQTKAQQNADLNTSLETLEKLGELKEKGIITEEEFTTRKSTILGDMPSTQPTVTKLHDTPIDSTKAEKTQPIKKKTGTVKKLFSGLFIIIVILAVIGALTDEDKEQSNDDTPQPKSSTEKQTSINNHVNKQNYDDRTKFRLAVLNSKNPDEEVKNLIKNGANIESKDKNGNTALMELASLGEEEGVRILLVNGADVNARNNRGQTALISASTLLSSVDVVSELISAGACVTAEDRKGKTALDHAREFAANVLQARPDDKSFKIKAEKIQHLLIEGAKSNCANPEKCIPPPKGYIFNYEYDVLKNVTVDDIKQILSSGVNVNQSFDIGLTSGWTLLMNAAEFNTDVNVIKKLLEMGANINATSSTGETALSRAIKNNPNFEITKLLLNAGAKLSDKYKNNLPLKNVVAVYNNEVTNINMSNARGETPLILATMYISPIAVKLLLENGADVNARTKSNETALIFAVKWRGFHTLETAKLLLDAGIDATIRDVDGKTALDYTSKWPKNEKSLEYIRILKQASTK